MEIGSAPRTCRSPLCSRVKLNFIRLKLCPVYHDHCGGSCTHKGVFGGTLHDADRVGEASGQRRDLSCSVTAREFGSPWRVASNRVTLQEAALSATYLQCDFPPNNPSRLYLPSHSAVIPIISLSLSLSRFPNPRGAGSGGWHDTHS